MDFDAILGTDLLSKNYASMDCHEKKVTFRMLEKEEFISNAKKEYITCNICN